MFQFSQKVLFKHCDPAGIVFYPRYFEMINDTVEEFFEQELEYSFAELLKTGGVPTVQINATFSAPSKLGDALQIGLSVARLGRSSVDLCFDTSCANELRFAAKLTLVFVDDNRKPKPWSDSLRQSLNNHLQGDDQCRTN